MPSYATEVSSRAVLVMVIVRHGVAYGVSEEGEEGDGNISVRDEEDLESVRAEKEWLEGGNGRGYRTTSLLLSSSDATILGDTRGRKGRSSGLLDARERDARHTCENMLADVSSAAMEWRHCSTSFILMENCLLRCMSAQCYDEVYGNDALEEGEVDVVRSRKFRSCMRVRIHHITWTHMDVCAFPSLVSLTSSSAVCPD